MHFPADKEPFQKNNALPAETWWTFRPRKKIAPPPKKFLNSPQTPTRPSAPPLLEPPPPPGIFNKKKPTPPPPPGASDSPFPLPDKKIETSAKRKCGFQGPIAGNRRKLQEGFSAQESRALAFFRKSVGLGLLHRHCILRLGIPQPDSSGRTVLLLLRLLLNIITAWQA